MTQDDEDIKSLLGRALVGEPPLRIDRDEVFRQGRRKLRARRRLEAGGAVAGVVVAVVAAVLVSGLVGDDEPDHNVPPAASRTVTTTPPPPSAGMPSSALTTTESPPSMPSAEPVSAQTLTAAFKAANLLPAGLQPTSARFALVGSAYELRADLIGSGREGSLYVTVEGRLPGSSPDVAAFPDVAAGCSDVRPHYTGCQASILDGVSVIVAGFTNYDTGEKLRMAFAIHADGTAVTAIAANVSDRQRAVGKPPAGPPIVSDEVLSRIVVEPGLRYVG